MAERGRRPGFYVYRIYDGLETVYIGKGCSRRLANQISRFRMSGEIIEGGLSEDEAFKRERFWIAELKPTANKCAGGNGGRSIPVRLPAWYSRFLKEYQKVGPRRYVAQAILKKLNERNCEQFGVSKVDIFRLREVANGCWC